MMGPNHEPLLIPFHEFLSQWCGETLQPVALPMRINARLTRILERLIDEYIGTWAVRGMCHYFPAHKAVIEILCTLVEHIFSRVEEAGVHADSPLMRARLEIERRYEEKLTLRELAAKAALSPEHFCRAYRGAFGGSPMAYQKELRLREAKDLLSTSSMHIGEIASAVGFQSVYNFSRFFTKRIGCTPTSYRARMLGKKRPSRQ
jgi:AraC-like DNA-binding protein